MRESSIRLDEPTLKLGENTFENPHCQRPHLMALPPFRRPLSNFRNLSAIRLILVILRREIDMKCPSRVSYRGLNLSFCTRHHLYSNRRAEALAKSLLGEGVTALKMWPWNLLVMTSTEAQITLVAEYLFIFAFGVSWGPVVWVLLGEMFQTASGRPSPSAPEPSG
jgi:Sugar (and other) transporter